jgi:hypothetical protein
VSCISGATSNRWIPIQNRSSGPHLSSAELEIHGKYYFNTFYFCCLFFYYLTFSMYKFLSLLFPFLFPNFYMI